MPAAPAAASFTPAAPIVVATTASMSKTKPVPPVETVSAANPARRRPRRATAPQKPSVIFRHVQTGTRRWRYGHGLSRRRPQAPPQGGDESSAARVEVVRRALDPTPTDQFDRPADFARALMGRGSTRRIRTSLQKVRGVGRQVPLRHVLTAGTAGDEAVGEWRRLAQEALQRVLARIG